MVFTGTNSAFHKKSLVLGLNLLNLFMQRDETSQFFHGISVCCSMSIYRQPLHMLELPINIITANMGFTVLGFYLLMHRQNILLACVLKFSSSHDFK